MNSYTFDFGDRLFWFKLGTHTCNMKRMSHFCGSILSHNFAKSSRFCTKFSPIGNSFIHVQGILDSIVCSCFPKNEDNDFSETLGVYVNHLRPNDDQRTSYTICDVFYNLQSIEEPDNVGPFRGGRYSKRITYEQYDYIVSFVQQFGEYLDFLEHMINHMVNPAQIPKKCSWSEKEWNSKRALLKNSVQQLRKKWESLHIISEIETE